MSRVAFNFNAYKRLWLCLHAYMPCLVSLTHFLRCSLPLFLLCSRAYIFSAFFLRMVPPPCVNT
jgi:hypothetical protein